MHVPASAILAVVLMALLSGHLRFTTERYWVGLRLLGRVIATLVGLFGLVYLGQQAHRRAHEYRCLEHVARETAYTRRMISLLEEAANVEPTNFDTTYALGEALRRSAWEGGTGSEKLIWGAQKWFRRGTRLNPHDPYNYMKVGMCLDWLGRHGEAAPYFEKAIQCDPN